MKLNLLFIVMDLLTFLAYPIVFVHGKLRQFSKSRERITLAKSLVACSSHTGQMTDRKITNIRKKGTYAYSKDKFSRPAGALCFS